MALDPDNPTPLYVQLADELRGQIQRGELTGRVPSIKTYSQMYGVSMGTAERALGILRDEGLLVMQSGRGAFVAKRA